MPFPWQIFLKILGVLLRVISKLPRDWDHTEATGLLADAVEGNGVNPPPVP